MTATVDFETTNFGHPFFRVRKKPFCIFGGEEGAPSIAFKVQKSEVGMSLDDPRFFATPYVHRYGWVSIHAQGRLDWKEIAELVKSSYALTACARPARKSASSI
jgi:predicted DNA-binding protein (MmcQ/YjbR family)